MIPAELEALALADAVGALDAEEQRTLAAQVAALSPEDQAAVARLYDTALAVAASAEPATPPPHVRARVLAAARTPGRYTLRAEARDDWFATPFAGITARVLAVDRASQMATLLLRAEPGAVYPSHHHHGGEECYVIRGSVVIDGQTLRAGDFHHADAGSDHGEIRTEDGAEVMIVGAVEDYLPGVQ
ncbi:MAG: cupin domain-containing protein [Vicinamibacterales bacterium]